MPDVRINLGSAIDDRDLFILRNSIKDMEPGEEITIRLEAADAHHAFRITGELDRQGFDYQPKGGDGRDYFIIAKKKE